MNKHAFFLFAGIAALLFGSCSKWELDRKNFPFVITQGYELGEDSTSVKLCLAIDGFVDDTSATTACGHVWATFSDSLTLQHSLGKSNLRERTNTNDDTPICDTDAKGLPLNTQIFYRAYLIYDGQERYGDIKSFFTGSLGEITFEIFPSYLYYSNNKGIRADITGQINGLPGGLSLNNFGFIWSQEIDPQYGISPGLTGKIDYTSHTEPLPFRGTIDNLQAGEMLYIRPFLALSDSIYLGAVEEVEVANIWTPVLNFPGQSRTGAWAFNLGDTVYVGQGEDPALNNVFFQDVFAFSPDDNQWKYATNVPYKSKDAVSFVLGTQGYVGTGRFGGTGDLKDSFWSFSPSSMIWTPVAPFGGGKTEKAVSFVLDGKAYVGTGKGTSSVPATSYRNTFYQFDGTAWVQIAPYPGTACIDAVAFTLNGTAYVGTGKGSNGAYLKEFYTFDPVTGWDQTPISLPEEAEGRAGAIAFTIGNKAYIGGGESETGILLQDFWCFDSQTKSWSRLADIPGLPRTEAISFSFNGKGYAGLGQGVSNITLGDIWEYTPLGD